MEKRMPFICPACQAAMTVTELTCPTCDTQVKGQFNPSPLLHLTSQQLDFAEVFIRCRGNIREVERELGISYPTVRSRLDEVINHLGYHTQEPSASEADGIEAIRQFESGDLSFEETLEKLRRG